MIISKKVKYKDKEKTVNSVLEVVWSKFYENLKLAEDSIDLAIWVRSDSPARTVAIPASQEINYEITPEFTVGVFVTDFDDLCEEIDAHADSDEEFFKAVAPLFAELDNWLVEGIARSWRGKEIQRRHKASQLKSLGVYITNHGDFIASDFAEM